ncbi:MAG: hypothetical protein AB8B95_14870 [Pseudohongiellaceae bacterium]
MKKRTRRTLYWRASFSQSLLCCLGVFLSFTASAQSSDDWTGLRRSIYDTDDATLRVPCVRVANSSGGQVAGLAPAYSINLKSAGSSFTLGENLRALTEMPTSCLDSLILSNDGTSATYTTSSAQLDSDAAIFRDTYFTIAMTANLQVSPALFSVNSAVSRNYARAGYQSDALLNFVSNKQQIFDDSDLTTTSREIVRRLVVSEPGVYDAVCRFDQLPSSAVEELETVNGNRRFRMNQNLTNASNGSVLFHVFCDVYNRDLNLFETRLERIATWIIALP